MVQIKEVMLMINYFVLIGDPVECHTREDYPSREVAEARAVEWRRAGFTAQVFEVRLDLETLEVTHTPLH